jgi:hypothetical protein
MKTFDHKPVPGSHVTVALGDCAVDGHYISPASVCYSTHKKECAEVDEEKFHLNFFFQNVAYYVGTAK